MRLHLGCGRDPRAGYVNLDRVALSGVDVVADLEHSLPFRDDVFEEVLAVHVLELVSELRRVSRDRAVWRVAVPHFSSAGAHTDPTHRRFFGYFSFDYFRPGAPFDFYSPVRLRIRRRRLRWYWLKNERRVVPSRTLTSLVNLWPLFYERFACWMLPTHEVEFELELDREAKSRS